MATATSATRDILVIGGSSGGLDALRTLVRGLEPGLPASVFVVLHLGSSSQLAQILDKSGPLPAMPATSGEHFEHGRIYVAVPGFHLLLHDSHILLRRGPRENLSRPAIDVLFRSAAASFGSRVVGVVLSGALSDGTAGLRAIKRCGGLAVVQDPVDALVSGMPRSALRHVEADHVCRIKDMPRLLTRLVREPAGPTPDIPLDVRIEAAIAAQELLDMRADDMLGTPSRFTCPECHGALWEIDDGSMLRFRCHVGHAFSADTVLVSQDEEIDRLLGTLLRSHQERAALTNRMAKHERANEHHALADHLESRARDYEHDVKIMRKLLRSGEAGSGATSQRGEESISAHEHQDE
ncbi:MAG: chemotaxis protein CheB [Rhodospirillales bacterium]|nr:chemotaxis protein CheB [Rhodospirillales bacterium]